MRLARPAQECRWAPAGAVGCWQCIWWTLAGGVGSVLEGWEGWVVKGGERVSGPAGVLLSWRARGPHVCLQPEQLPALCFAVWGPLPAKRPVILRNPPSNIPVHTF